MMPLQAEQIQFGLETPFDCMVFDSLPSTQTFLKTLPPLSHNYPICCLAETQTAGQGRSGKTWYSPHGKNIYCSIRFSNHQILSPYGLSGLSLMLGLSFIQTLINLFPGFMPQMKWPNDLYYQKKKFSGIIVHQIPCYTIIGFGINVNMNAEEIATAEHPMNALMAWTGTLIDRNQLITSLLNALSRDLCLFQEYGFPFWQPRWKTFDMFYHKKIRVFQKDIEYIGFDQGVTERGELILDDLEGKRHLLHHGDVSFHHSKLSS